MMQTRGYILLEHSAYEKQLSRQIYIVDVILDACTEVLSVICFGESLLYVGVPHYILAQE